MRKPKLVIVTGGTATGKTAQANKVLSEFLAKGLRAMITHGLYPSEDAPVEVVIWDISLAEYDRWVCTAGLDQTWEWPIQVIRTVGLGQDPVVSWIR